MSARRVESFLLRLVVEDDGSIDPAQWHGRIQHVATGSSQSVEQLQDVVAFIRAHLGEVTSITSTTSATIYADSSSPPRKLS
ncbi:MAG: hypothetical protein ACLFVO_17935 [Chloroflexaceae bacterium]